MDERKIICCKIKNMNEIQEKAAQKLLAKNPDFLVHDQDCEIYYPDTPKHNIYNTYIWVLYLHNFANFGDIILIQIYWFEVNKAMYIDVHHIYHYLFYSRQTPPYIQNIYN